MREIEGFSVRRKRQIPAEYFRSSDTDSERHVRLHYCSRNHSVVLPTCHRNAKSDRQKNIIVDAVAPCRQPIFTAIKRIRANVRCTRPDTEKRLKKFRFRGCVRGN